MLRWGHLYARAPDDKPCSSIFSDEARGKFDEWALGYLTHLVFRVLHRRGEDEGQASSYTVQILVSPGVSLSEVEASSPSGRGSVPQVHTEPLLISSRPDLSLEDVDLFLDSLGCNEPHDDGSGAHPPPTPPAPDRAGRILAPDLALALALTLTLTPYPNPNP